MNCDGELASNYEEEKKDRALRAQDGRWMEGKGSGHRYVWAVWSCLNSHVNEEKYSYYIREVWQSWPVRGRTKKQRERKSGDTLIINQFGCNAMQVQLSTTTSSIIM